MNFAHFSVEESWGNGFVGKIKFDNFTKDAIKGWTVEFEAPFKIAKIWNAKIVKQEGNRYTVRNVQWNRELSAGKSLSFGFVADLPNGNINDPNNRPDGFTLNGQQPNGQQPGETVDTSTSTAFEVEDNWGNGFVGYITFENATPDSVKGWTLKFEAPFQITEIWDAEIVETEDGQYTLSNVSWNSELKAGEQVRFGFVANLANGNIEDLGNQPSNFEFQGLESTNPGPIPPVNEPTQPNQPPVEPVNPVEPAEPVEPVEPVEPIEPVAPTPPAEEPITPPVTPPATPPEVDEPLPPVGGQFNYGEALQKSFLFYEAQRAGKLPDDNRIDWRGDSTLNDGADVGLDLSGGYFDAGDTVKFGMPMTASMTLLAWGANEYRDGYERSGQLDEVMDAIKWGTDYILKAHVTEGGKTKAFYGQVGLGDLDHAYFGRVEDMNIDRPAFKIDAQNPGTDLAAEAAASLASAAILFRDSDPAYADELLTNAKQLYEFAETYRDRYSNSITDADKFYKSWDGYEDELAWGATWLYKATGDEDYLAKAEGNYDGVGWTQGWGDKNFGTSILLAQEQPEHSRYRQDAEVWLDNWADGAGGVQYTSGGFAWIGEWGSARMSATAAFLAGVYSDTVQDPNGKYADFAEGQVDYLLGDNPNKFSYMVGFGNNYAKQPHHRNATGTPDFNTAADNKHILYGALVGGPTAPRDDAYRDVRSDYVANEVALDYNAGITGALARMYDQFGGNPLTEAQLDGLPGISVPESNP